MQTILQTLRLATWVAALMLFGTAIAWAQNGNDDWDDDGWGETAKVSTTAPAAPAKAAKLTVNGSEVNLKSTVTLEKGAFMDVRVEQLRGGTNLILELYKAGVKVAEQKFTANKSGTLELEATVPAKKFKGEAHIRYTSSDGTPVHQVVDVEVR
jgi:hypothetical protein